MKSTYKRLGNLIVPVSEKNSELVTCDLRGVNYQKYFMPSVANTHGVDLSNYKVIRNNQFACNLMHVGRDECLPIALHKGNKPIIVSPAYFSFQITDESEILSDYLFIWFKRPEFDREACFYTDADVRHGLVKSAFLDMKIAVPPIEEQRKIVAEYQAIERRIESNRCLIASLEATAQTIYRHMFVDNIDPENLPQGWRMGTIGELCVCNDQSYSNKDNWNFIKYLDSSGVTSNSFDNYQLLDTHTDEIPSRAKRKVRDNDFIISMVRPSLCHYGLIRGDLSKVLVSTAFAVIRSKYREISNELIYLWVTDSNNIDKLNHIAEMSKATYPSVVPDDILNIEIAIPPLDSAALKDFTHNIVILFDTMHTYRKEIYILEDLKPMLQSKLSNL